MPANGNAANANIVRLNAAVEEIEALKEEVAAFAAYKDKNGKALQILSKQHEMLTYENEELRERIEYLETLLGVDDVEKAGGDPVSSEGAAGVSVTEMEAMNETERTSLLSMQAAQSQPIKALVNTVFKQLMGVMALDGKNLPEYPYQIGREHEQWPKDPATNNPLLRFMWQKTATNRINHDGLTKVFETVRALGPKLQPASIPDLNNVYDIDLIDRIKSKFSYMSSEFKKAHHVPNSDEDDDFGEVQEGQIQKKIGRAVRNSRVQSKLAARIRKRPLSAYRDAKFDSAFITNAMSDDDDDPDSIPGKAAKKWISRAPDYRSEMVQKLYDDIDAIADPDPDKAKAATLRVRGLMLENSVPPKARNLKNRIRAWQVKPELLAEHESWLSMGRIAPSGTAWGDSEDPTAEPETNKRKRGVDVKKAKGKRRAVDKERAEKSKEELAQLLDGAQVADFINF